MLLQLSQGHLTPVVEKIQEQTLSLSYVHFLRTLHHPLQEVVRPWQPRIHPASVAGVEGFLNQMLAQQHVEFPKPLDGLFSLQTFWGLHCEGSADFRH